MPLPSAAAQCGTITSNVVVASSIIRNHENGLMHITQY